LYCIDALSGTEISANADFVTNKLSPSPTQQQQQRAHQLSTPTKTQRQQQDVMKLFKSPRRKWFVE